MKPGSTATPSIRRNSCAPAYGSARVKTLPPGVEIQNLETTPCKVEMGREKGQPDLNVRLSRPHRALHQGQRLPVMNRPVERLPAQTRVQRFVVRGEQIEHLEPETGRLLGRAQR